MLIQLQSYTAMLGLEHVSLLSQESLKHKEQMLLNNMQHQHNHNVYSILSPQSIVNIYEVQVCLYILFEYL